MVGRGSSDRLRSWNTRITLGSWHSNAAIGTGTYARRFRPDYPFETMSVLAATKTAPPNTSSSNAHVTMRHGTPNILKDWMRCGRPDVPTPTGNLRMHCVTLQHKFRSTFICFLTGRKLRPFYYFPTCPLATQLQACDSSKAILTTFQSHAAQFGSS